jgi:hypothetical protein
MWWSAQCLTAGRAVGDLVVICDIVAAWAMSVRSVGYLVFVVRHIAITYVGGYVGQIYRIAKGQNGRTPSEGLQEGANEALRKGVLALKSVHKIEPPIVDPRSDSYCVFLETRLYSLEEALRESAL